MFDDQNVQKSENENIINYGEIQIEKKKKKSIIERFKDQVD